MALKSTIRCRDLAGKLGPPVFDVHSEVHTVSRRAPEPDVSLSFEESLGPTGF